MLLTTINDNTTTTFTDTLADSSLTSSAPTTSTTYQIIWTSGRVLVAEDEPAIRYEYIDLTIDDNLNVVNTLDQGQPKLPPADTQVGIISETNLAVTTYPYWRPVELGKYYEWALQYKCSCSTLSTRIKVWGTLDPDAAVPADNSDGPSVDWIDITYDIFGIPIILAPTSGSDKDCKNIKNIRYQRIMISILPKNATNLTQFNLLQA